MLFCFINGFTGGFGICLGQKCGAKDEKGMRKSVAVSTLLSIAFTVVLTLICCLLAHQILRWMQIPSDISGEAYDYMFVVLLGTGATVFYNMISNMLRALGDSKTPLYFLVFSSVLNIFLDILFIVPLHMGVAGAAWATILSQFLSAVLSLIVGLKNFPILHLRREDFTDLKDAVILHLKTGFPMGFQMSVMCIGQLAMQTVVNSLGIAAVAGYTAASKADQFSVLVNNVMMTAISNYVAQNFGVCRTDEHRLLHV
ncbi:MATE family efflux transporter [Blautia luti]|uniref:MATE family efflux transporter n=1 Tax=Blautia luti TaxID=89014 RepID=UPI002ED6B7F8